MRDSSLDPRTLPRRLLDLGRRLVEEIGRDDLSGVAAQMTYYFMLASFPTLILLIGILDLLPLERDVERFTTRFLSQFSGDVSQLLARYLQEFASHRPSGGILLWSVAGLWAASRGMRGARKGLNKVFRVRRRAGIVHTRLSDLGLTVFFLGVAGFAYTVLVGGQQLAEAVAVFFNLGFLFTRLWWLLRWPVVLASMLGMTVLAYRLLPARKLAWRHLFAGAVPAVLGWILLGSGFRLWLRLAGSFDKLYGSLASFFLLMFLLWLVSLLLLLGAEIAARLADRAEAGSS